MAPDLPRWHAALSEPQLTLVQLTEIRHERCHLTVVGIADQSFDSDTLSRAVAALTRRHPALRAGIDLTSAADPAWVVAGPGEAHVDALRPSDDGEISHAVSVALDRIRFNPARAPLVRFVVAPCGRGTLLCTVVHPALLDRPAALRVHAGLLAQYARESDHSDVGSSDVVDSDDSDVVDSDVVDSEVGGARPGEPAAFPPASDVADWVAGFDGAATSPAIGWATRPVGLLTGWDTNVQSDSGDDLALGLGVRHCPVPDRLIDALRDHAAAAGATVAEALFAVHVKAVSAATGRDDLVIAVELNPTAATRPDQVYPGCGTAPVIARVTTAGESWSDFTGNCRAALLRAQRFRDLSVLRLYRSIGSDRLIDISFAAVAAGDGVTVYPPFDGAALVEFLLLGSGQVMLRVTGGPDLGGDQLDELVRLHTAALAHCAEGGRPHRDLSALDEASREIVLRRWNGEVRDYPLDRCVHQLFEQQVRRTPAAVAVADGSGRLTYRQLNVAANRLAHRLRAAGLGRGDVSGVFTRRGSGLVVAFLAVLKAGAAYLPLDPRQPADRIDHLLRDSAATMVITDLAYRSQVPAGPWTVLRVDEPGDGLACSDGNPDVGCSPDDLMYLIYTSGSTGAPKGVEVPHAGVVNYLGWCIEAYAAHGSGGTALFSSVAFDAVVPNIYTPLITGQRVYVLDEALGMAEVARCLAGEGPFSFLKLTPGQLAVLGSLLEPAEAAGLANALAVGADAFPTRILRDWRRNDPATPMFNEYGPTEASVGNCVYVVTDDETDELVPIGRPIPNTNMYVLNEHGDPAGVGVAGELYIGGACVVRGYAGRPDLTGQRFVPDPFRNDPAARMYRTGDIGRWLPSGTLEFLGRRDDQVKIRGYRVEPAEVEAAMVRHPSMSAAVVTATGPTRETLSLTGYYVAAPNIDPADVRQHLTNLVPEYLVPTHLVPIPAVPLNANGKVDRAALPTPAAGPQAAQQRQDAVNGAVGMSLVLAWHRTFGLVPAGPDDPIAGPADSPSRALRLAACLHRDTGLALPEAVRAVTASATLSDLAERLATAGSAPAQALGQRPAARRERVTP